MALIILGWIIYDRWLIFKQLRDYFMYDNGWIRYEQCFK